MVTIVRTAQESMYVKVLGSAPGTAKSHKPCDLRNVCHIIPSTWNKGEIIPTS